MVSEQEIQALADDGVIVLRNVVTPDWLERIAQAIERDIADPAPYVHGYAATDGGSGRFHGNLRIWESDPELAEFCLRSNLPELAAKLLASDNVNLPYDQVRLMSPACC